MRITSKKEGDKLEAYRYTLHLVRLKGELHRNFL